ncbi:MAG: SusC/RagA family TonB-linked outer membrane protein [Paludibacteraceae bacterium]
MKDARIKLKTRTVTVVVLMFVFGLNASAQKMSISGVVKDDTGEPIIGASVVEKGTTNGLTTNFNGEFTLSVSSNATLLISYIGYKTAEVSVGGQRNIIITLQEDTQLLGEVVAIGYATVKKEDATGSVTAIKPDEMNKGLTTTPQDMITGKIAGVTVTNYGGKPGEGAAIRIRGGSSLNASNDPLIVIDGLTMDNNAVGVSNPLSTVNPNDIESFTVLKDASATAIYGSRASNGVIIITTKKGKAGSKPTLSYDGNVSIGTIGKYLDVLSADEFRKFVNETYGNNLPLALGDANTNWQKEIYRTAISHQHNLTLKGGLKHMPYRFSFGYDDQNGIVKTSEFERYTGSMNLNPSLLDDHLKLNLNAKGMIAKNRYSDDRVVGSAASFDPTRSVTDNNEPYKTLLGGYWQWMSSGTMYNSEAIRNPVSLLELKNNRSTAYDVIGNADIDYKLHFFPDMRAHLTLGYDRSQAESKYDSPITAPDDNLYGRTGSGDTYRTQKLLTLYLDYAKEFGVNNIDVMGGYEYQKVDRWWDSSYRGLLRYDSNGNNVVDESDNYYNVVNSPGKTQNALVSLFGRVNYNLLDKYLFTVTYRADGSSRFAEGNKWGYFPSAAFAWKINQESFLKDNRTLTDLKLRLGYGVTGQQELNQGDFPYLPLYVINIQHAYYQFGDQYYKTFKPAAYDSNIKWEQTATYNVGIDWGLLDNRIQGSIDAYYRKTTDLINVAYVSALTNFDVKVTKNIGSLENRGIEFAIAGKPIVTKDLTWDISYNATFNRNKILELTSTSGQGLTETGGISGGTGGSIQAHAVGYPANSFYVYEQVYNQNGKPIEGLFQDRNGDGIINSDDRYLYQKPSPDITMGLSSRLIYKRFDFGVSMHSNIVNYVYNNYLAGNAQVGSAGYSSLGNGWYSNTLRAAKELGFTEYKESAGKSDYFIENASFLRIDNITVGYSFNKLFNVISGGRIYATVQNPFLITNYTGLDPEVFGGIDNNIYPRPIMSIVGLSLNF